MLYTSVSQPPGRGTVPGRERFSWNLSFYFSKQFSWINVLWWKYSEENNIRECVGKLRSRCWPQETTICYKILLVEWLITNLNVILYLSTCHTVYISLLILFMIMPLLLINTYVSLMYELRKMERYLRVNLLGPGPRLMKKNLPGRGLTKVEKHWCRQLVEAFWRKIGPFQGLYLHRNTQRRKYTKAPSLIRTHDPYIQAPEESTCQCEE